MLRAITTVATLAFAGLVAAEPASRIEHDWFAFHIPTLSNDQTAGSPIDLSFLNAEPAGSRGHLRAEGERIVDGEGNAVRLFGVNISDFHTMPPADVAAPVARRLAELGVNFVRLHYSDIGPPDGLMRADAETVDPAKLDDLFRFVAALAEAGIYVDVNLHVARVYPGTPAGWPMQMGKGVDRALPELIEDQKRFARVVLTTPNPHRGGRTLAEDPAVAIVELNNENSLMTEAWSLLPGLPGDALASLRPRWIAYLKERYGSTDALREAWNGDLPPLGELVIDGPDALAAEASGGGVSSVGSEHGALVWSVSKPGEQAWNHQLHANDLPIADGNPLVLRVRYRATSPVNVRLMNAGEPWASASPTITLPATDDWAERMVSWTVANGAPDVPVRLSLDALNQPGKYEFADLSLQRGALQGLAVGQTLEAGNVAFPGLDSNGRAAAAWADFCKRLDLAYADEMMRFLRDDLGVRAMLLDTQVHYGGGTGVVRESRHSDLIDIHVYPAHPEATQVDGQRAYRVAQRSMLGEAFDSYAGISFWRVAGKPFGVSEFDLNPPQDHNSESFPLFSLLAAYQDWNMLAEYSWLNFQQNYEPQTLAHPYHTSGNPAQIVFMPAAALLFRNGLVETAGDGLTLSVPERALLDAGVDWSAITSFWSAAGVGSTHPLRQRLTLAPLDDADEATLDGTPADAGDIVMSDSAQIRIGRSEAGKEVLTVDAPQVKLAFGHTLGRTLELGDVAIEVVRAGTRSGDYANVALVSLDGEPIETSKRLLLAQAARVHGEGWRFHDDEDTLVTFGEGPMRAEPAGVRLRLPGDGWRLTPLDGSGRPAGEPSATLDTKGRSSMWFLIERQ